MSDEKYITVPGMTADPHIVRLFTNHLAQAFQAFIDEYPGDVDHVDGFMAAHNLHKWVVQHLAEDTDWEGWWFLAAGTFQVAMGRQDYLGEDIGDD